MYGLLYEKYTPETLTDLKSAITQKGWIGFNVTTPYKDAIYSLLDESAPEAAAIQAVNTVLVMPDGRWVGYNTDYMAARYILSEMTQVYESWDRLMVLGTGGAARAVAYAHAQLFPEIPITFISRQAEKKIPFPAPHQVLSYEAIQSHPWEERLLLVQATPIGMMPDVLAMPPFPVEGIQPAWIVWDLIYNPNPTLFLMRAKDRGARIDGGIQLFRKQADYALELWSAHWQKHYKPRRA